MTIKTKLTLNVVTVLAVTCTVVGVSVVGMGIVKSRLSELTEKSTPFQTRSMELQRAVHAAAADLVKVGTAASAPDLKKYRADAEASLQQVATAEQAVEALSGGEKIGAHRELTTQAKALVSVMEDRLKTEQGTHAADAQLREKSAGIVQRLEGLEKRVRGLQTARSAAYAKSVDSTNRVGASIQWLDQLRGKMKDAEIWCYEVEHLQDRAGLEDLETRGGEFKMTVAAYRVLIKQWNFGQANMIQEKLTGLDEKFPEIIDLKKAVLAGTESPKKLAPLLAETKNTVGGILVLVNLENGVVRPANDAEVSRQAGMFTQAGKSTEVLAGSAALTATALSVEGLSARLFSVETVDDVDRIAEALENGFTRMRKDAKALDGTLKELDAKEERKLLAGAIVDADSMEGLLFADDGILSEVRRGVEMKEKAAKAMEDLRGIVLKQAERAKKTLTSARDAQEKSILGVNATVRFSRLLVVATGCAAIAFGILFGAWIYRSIARPLSRLMAVADRIASGDLGHAASAAAADDEIGKVEAAMAAMVTNLKAIVEK
ncbi:MAG: methyl-accepting chemotaxis protein, partial [Deltaproteobacteria bacterium]|nr:methyl-accepting chemotaxis protein [Deltaproteobacteria bacterium]